MADIVSLFLTKPYFSSASCCHYTGVLLKITVSSNKKGVLRGTETRMQIRLLVGDYEIPWLIWTKRLNNFVTNFLSKKSQPTQLDILNCKHHWYFKAFLRKSIKFTFSSLESWLFQICLSAFTFYKICTSR